MTAIPETLGRLPPSAIFTYNGCRHVLLLSAEHSVDVARVLNTLRDAYHDVAGRARAKVHNNRLSVDASSVVGILPAVEAPPPLRVWGKAAMSSLAVMHSSVNERARKLSVRNFGSSDDLHAATLERVEVMQMFADALDIVQQREIRVARRAIGLGVGLLLFFVFCRLADGVVAVSAMVGCWWEQTLIFVAWTDTRSLVELPGYAVRVQMYTAFATVAAVFAMLALRPVASQLGCLRVAGGTAAVMLSCTGCVTLGAHIELIRVESAHAADPVVMLRTALRGTQHIGVAALAIVALTVHWRQPRPLLAAEWAILSTFSAIEGACDWLDVVAMFATGAFEGAPDWFAPALCTTSALSLGIGLFVAWSPWRACCQTFLLARATRGAGADASLAPLLGWGSEAGPRDASDVCVEAEKAFKVITLDSAMLQHIRGMPRLGSDEVDRLAAAAFHRGSSSFHSASSYHRSVPFQRECEQAEASEHERRGVRLSHQTVPEACDEGADGGDALISTGAGCTGGGGGARGVPGGGKPRVGPKKGVPAEQAVDLSAAVCRGRPESAGGCPRSRSDSPASMCTCGGIACSVGTCSECGGNSLNSSAPSSSQGPSPACSPRHSDRIAPCRPCATGILHTSEPGGSTRGEARAIVPPTLIFTRASGAAADEPAESAARSDHTEDAMRHTLPSGTSSPHIQLCLRQSGDSLYATPPHIGLRRMSGSEGGGGRSIAPHADAYVVHSQLDSSDSKARALGEWAAAFRQRARRPPRIYLDVLCADPSLMPCELLAHLPVYMAQCHRLLLLASPSLSDRLWCVTELYLWRAMGGRLEDVDIALVRTDADGRQATSAAFDTFHISFAATADREVAHVLARVVDIATVGRFNRSIRDVMPQVLAAVAQAEKAGLDTRQPGSGETDGSAA